MYRQIVKPVLLTTILRTAASLLAVHLSGIAIVNVSAAQESVAFPLSPYNEPVIVPVTIGNAQHLCFIDSGSTNHAFHTSLRSDLGKPLGKRTGSALGGGDFEIEAFEAPMAMLGTMQLARQAPVGCIDLSGIQSASGREIEGMLGMPLFRTHIIQVDFDRRVVSFLSVSTKPMAKWGQPVEVANAKSGLPKIDVRVGDQIIEKCILDTGYTGTIVLSSKVFSRLSENQFITPLEDQLTMTAIGIQRTRQGRLPKVGIAGFQHENLLVSDGGDESRIGLKYLRRYRVTFDLGRGRMYLAKGAEFDRPDQEPVGIGVLRRSGKTQVVAVQRNSAAEKAGMLVNDEVVSVAGTAINDMPLAEVRWMLSEKADSNGIVVLGIRRAGKEQSVAIRIDD